MFGLLMHWWFDCLLWIDFGFFCSYDICLYMLVCLCISLIVVLLRCVNCSFRVLFFLLLLCRYFVLLACGFGCFLCR